MGKTVEAQPVTRVSYDPRLGQLVFERNITEQPVYVTPSAGGGWSDLGTGIIGVLIAGVERLRLSATELLVSASATFKGPRPWVDVRAYGAVGDGTTDDTAAILAAIAAAPVGSTIFFPTSTSFYRHTAQLTFDGLNIRGGGPGTILKCTAALGASTPAVIVTDSAADTRQHQNVSDIEFRGPGSYSLGVKTATCDGVKITGNAKVYFDRVKIQLFDSGEVLANSAGHIYHRNVEIANNYYGVYCTNNTFDYMYTDCLVNGNTFANFATPSDQGFEGLVIRNTHVGFAPYGIYQEATPTNQGTNKTFLSDVILSHARFEAIGNAAIHSDATQTAGVDFSLTGNLWIEHPGFSYNATYKIAARDKNFAVVLGQTTRVNTIIGGKAPFTTGTTNVYRIKQGGGASVSLVLVDAAAVTSQVQLDAGQNPIYAGYALFSQGGLAVADQMTLLGLDGTNANITFPAVANRYLYFNSTTVRFGGDNSQLLSDFNGNAIWRDSGNSYATRMGLTAAGVLTVRSATGGLGFGTGAGGAVTQITSSATAVTLNKPCGQVTTVALTTAAGAEERFTVNNTSVAATDTISVGTTYNGAGTPAVTVLKVAANAFDIVITNLHAANALDALMVINFAVIKAVAS